MTAKFALASSLLIAPAVAFAVADGPDHFTTRNLDQSQSLTVHLGPSMDAAASGSIAAGARCIRNLGCNATTDALPADGRPPQTWCHVEHGGVKGWAPAKYLAEAPCQSLPVPPIPLKLDKEGRASVKGELQGGRGAVYRIAAGAGQKLTIAMKASRSRMHS